MNAEQFQELLQNLAQGQQILQQAVTQQAAAFQQAQVRQQEESCILREVQDAQIRTLQGMEENRRGLADPKLVGKALQNFRFLLQKLRI